MKHCYFFLNIFSICQLHHVIVLNMIKISSPSHFSTGMLGDGLETIIIRHTSLVPRPPPFFCSSVWVQYNTRKRKSAKNREGLVSSIT